MGKIQSSMPLMTKSLSVRRTPLEVSRGQVCQRIRMSEMPVENCLDLSARYRICRFGFSPTSVQFKSEINDAFPCKRHQKRHLEFCIAHLLSRGSGVRLPPGAPHL